MIRELFPEIDMFISTHGNELINERICNNECYFVPFGRKTVLYLKTNAD